MSSKDAALLEAFYSMTNKLVSLRNMPVPIEGCEPLTAPSLHMLDIVGKNPGINNTILSQKLGISKSAVTQLSRKLTDKGFLNVEAKPENSKEICFTLTKTGWTAYRAHEDLHRKLYGKISARLSQLSDREMDDILSLMQEIIEGLDEYRHI